MSTVIFLSQYRDRRKFADAFANPDAIREERERQYRKAEMDKFFEAFGRNHPDTEPPKGAA